MRVKLVYKAMPYIKLRNRTVTMNLILSNCIHVFQSDNLSSQDEVVVI